MTSRPRSVPSWVRCTMCVTASGADLGLLVLTALGVAIGSDVVAAVGTFALWSVALAFGLQMPWKGSV